MGISVKSLLLHVNGHTANVLWARPRLVNMAATAVRQLHMRSGVDLTGDGMQTVQKMESSSLMFILTRY